MRSNAHSYRDCAASVRRRPAQLFADEGAREARVAFHGGRGHDHRLGDFLDFEAGEKAQIEHLAGARIKRVEGSEGGVDGDDLLGVGVNREVEVFQRIDEVTWPPPRLPARRARA